MTLDDIVAKVTDPYERPARLYPALFCPYWLWLCCCTARKLRL
jgi:hypothetical protein